MTKFIKYTIAIIMVSITFASCGSSNLKTTNAEAGNSKSTLIFSEDFSNGMENWRVEQMPKGTVSVKEGKLDIDDEYGCTVWFNQKLSGPIVIEYDVFVIKNGGANDRVSDLNCFWMASDPENPSNLFANAGKRGGKFSNYDSLQLYYMSIGGNDNKTTRFRRYVGNGERPLLPEFDFSDPKYMLVPNKNYHIKIVANNGVIQFYKDNELLINMLDKAPYTSGYFGLRTVKNHMTIDNFKVYQIKSSK